MHKAPHPDEIAYVRKDAYSSYREAKWALNKGYKFPLRLTFEEAKTALNVIQELQEDARGVAEVFPKNTINGSVWKWDSIVWFKSEELATYVKLMIQH